MKRELTIILSLVLGVMFLFSFKNKKEKPTPKNIALSNDQVQRKITEQITFAEKTQDLHETAERSRQTLDLSSLSSSAKKDVVETAPPGIDLRSDSNELNAYHDMQRDRKVIDYTNPSFIIQSQITEKLKALEIKKAYNEAYIQAFLENAKAHGYEVKLDEQNRVVSVKPIRRPNSVLELPEPPKELDTKVHSEKIQTAK